MSDAQKRDVPQGGWEPEEAMETPVEPSRCIWCKLHRHDWDEDVRPIPVGEDEVICSSCREDLRKYKRSDSWMLLVHEGFMDTPVMDVFEQAEQTIIDGLTSAVDHEIERKPWRHHNAAVDRTEDGGKN